MNNNQLPHNDPDLVLAKEIGECRDNRVDLNTISDYLPDYLLAYKKEKESVENQITVPQERIWKLIENELPANKQSSRIYSLNFISPQYLRIAAAILLAALVSLFYLIPSQTPDLIAETGQSITEVNLADGSKVVLRPHSALWKLSDDNENRQEYRLEGEGYFTVESNPEREFSVTASNGRVTVLGTRFVLSDWGNQTRVFLEEGSVQFEVIETGEKADLDPGEKAVISNKKLTMPEPAEEELFTSWMNNRLQFSNRQARSIFNELEYHFQIRIQAPGSIEQESLGGSITLDQKDQALRDLGMVLGGSFETSDGTTYQFVPETQ